MHWELGDNADILDSRTIIDRCDELRGCCVGKDEAEEFRDLLEVCKEGEGIPDWCHGATLISDDYFEKYAQELAEDIGAVASGASWPNHCIDWEQAAQELQTDYGEIEIGGIGYWARW